MKFTTRNTLFRCAALILCLVGTACATKANLETQVLVACQSFADAESALRPFKPTMTEDQIAAVHEAVLVAEPICTGENVTDPRSALEMVRAKLRQLVAMQNQMEASP